MPTNTWSFGRVSSPSFQLTVILGGILLLPNLAGYRLLLTLSHPEVNVMTHRTDCRPMDLFRSQSLAITSCQCGMIHLSLGPVSLRLSEAAFAGLADAVTLARLQLEGKTPPNTEPILLPSEFLAG